MRAAIRAWLTPKIIAGGVIVLILITVRLSAPLIAPYDPNAQNLSRASRPPAWMFGRNMLGTDAVGRDILSRLFYGARVSLVIAVLVVIISGMVGVVLGAISGYFAGVTDFLIQKLVEVVWAFPPLLLAIAIMAFLGQGLENLIRALVSQRWTGYWPASRGQAGGRLGRCPGGGGPRAGGAHLCRRGGGAGPHPPAHLPPPYHAEPVPLGGGDRHILYGVRYHRGGGVELPWPRRAARDSDLGQHAVRRADLHQHIVVAGAVPRSVHLLHRARYQPARRRTARYSRSAAQAVGVRHRLRNAA